MSVFLEYRKIRRTGALPLFLGGGVLAAVIPVANMAVRSEVYLAQQGDPVRILLDANWQMMAMLNVLLVVAGACLFYHSEYTGNAMQKMRSLPIRESSMFFGKAAVVIFMSALALVVEGGAIAFCSYYWFDAGGVFLSTLCKSFGYVFLLLLPCVLLSLIISEACKNMWVSLGIGVVCVFTATMLPTDHAVLSLFPFAMPFRILADVGTAQALHDLYAVAVELTAFGLLELALIKIRRLFA